MTEDNFEYLKILVRLGNIDKISEVWGCECDGERSDNVLVELDKNGKVVSGSLDRAKQVIQTEIKYLQKCLDELNELK